MYRPLLFVVLQIAVLCAVPASLALRFGEQCDASPIYSATWQYDDSCANVYLFCDPASNTCNYRGCTNSDYLANWDVSVHAFPPRCTGNTYCPDDNSGCKEKVAPGQHCEMQRDDECSGTNAICLNATCFIKEAPLGGVCGSDTTMYVSYDRDNYAFQQIIIRDNCTAGTYCVDGGCVTSKSNGASCEQDRECISEYCSTDGVCVNGPDVFRSIANWLWGVVGAAIVIFVLVVLLVLWFLHRYQSNKEHAKITKFFGDNEEFAKYAMLENDDAPLVHDSQAYNQNDSRTSVIYLTTPQYYESAALSNHREFRDSNVSLSQRDTPTRAHTSDRPRTADRARTPDLN